MLYNGAIVFAVLVSLHLSVAVEFTFELPDSERSCFFEAISKERKGTKVVLEYQVVQGGSLDVDVEVKAPSGRGLYKESRKQYDSYTWKAEEEGQYEICFSNEFSTFTHKVVYFDLQVGDEQPVVPGNDHATALTQLETSSVTIHEHLKTVIDYQTHHRLREVAGRGFAEELNERVLWWSIAEFALILAVGVGQVAVLRSFFSEKKSKATLT